MRTPWRSSGKETPFAAVCGRICIHPCEYKCRRGELDDPVAIRLLKRFAADWYFENIGLARAPFPVTQSPKRWPWWAPAWPG
jgi:NADH-quinone oxidoreductase subunit F